MKYIRVLFFGIVLFNLNRAVAFPLPVLLTIYDSNPAAVTITATGANSGVDDSSTIANDGVDLLGFFQTANGSDFFYQFLAGTLSGGNTGVVYNDIWTDHQSTGGDTFLDLSLYRDIDSAGQGSTQNFSTIQPAFTGSWTINFSAQGITSADLPTVGTVGQIFSGTSEHPGQVIGAWQVVSVPEPGTASLALLGLGAAALWRKRRSRP